MKAAKEGASAKLKAFPRMRCSSKRLCRTRYTKKHFLSHAHARVCFRVRGGERKRSVIHSLQLCFTPLLTSLLWSVKLSAAARPRRSNHEVSILERMKRIRQIDQAILIKQSIFSARDGKVLQRLIRVRLAAK